MVSRLSASTSGGQRRLATVRAAVGDNDVTTWQVRLRLKRMTTATSRGSRKQGSSREGRCGSKDGRGGWAALERATTIALDLQAGRVSKAKGAMKVATSRGGRKRAVIVRRGLRQWERRRQQSTVGNGGRPWGGGVEGGWR
ncbi:hypothetical protein B296_00006487 [Ensete ventricosum]|uniref:Uncharacterized protein n=1 Tax=Ensete ventricosum TaxID=4639 RepID=A0A427A6M6_ENSVE|nr:hypothetical protein B296_00006487 [Ensete ventricosum]